MRYLISVALVAMLAAACSDDDGTATDKPIFSVLTKDITIPAGTEITYCYYTHTTNTEPEVINKWDVQITNGIHHMIMFLNPSGVQPPDDTFEPDCSLVGLSMPIWMLASQESHDVIELPPDDGFGKPLGQTLPPKTAVYFQMHFINTSDQPIMGHLIVSTYGIPKGVEFTETAAYLTYNNSINLAPGVVNKVEQASCPVPQGVQFWNVVSHSHKQTTHTHIFDSETPDPAAMIYESDDWAHPVPRIWGATPFYTFKSPSVTWDCVYDNTGDNKDKTVVSGPSNRDNEMCMVASFMFPATKPVFCVYDTSIPGGCSCGE